MVRVSDRVRIRATGTTGKVLRIIAIVKGIVLNNPLAIIRLDYPDEDMVTLTTAFEKELELVEPSAGRTGS